ncbi:hypothetical protein DWA21_26610, partial [Acinetobacter baumannii]
MVHHYLTDNKKSTPTAKSDVLFQTARSIMTVNVNSFNAFAVFSMEARAISGGSFVACQLQPAFKTKEAPTLFTP